MGGWRNTVGMLVQTQEIGMLCHRSPSSHIGKNPRELASHTATCFPPGIVFVCLFAYFFIKPF